MIGYAASIGSAVAYGTVAVIGRKIVGDYAPPLVATAFSMAMGTAMVALLFVGDVRSDIGSAPRRGWIMLVLAGLAAAWGGSFW